MTNDYLGALGITQWHCRLTVSSGVLVVVSEVEEWDGPEEGDAILNPLSMDSPKPSFRQVHDLLDAMLKSIGLSSATVNIAWIPPDHHQKPMAFLNKKITLFKPKILLVLGIIAAQNLLQKNISLTKLRGHRWTLGTQQIPLIVTFSPAFLFRSPLYKAKAYADLLLAQQCLFHI